MAYVLVSNFKTGMVRERVSRVFGDAGDLWTVQNAHCTRAGDIERRKSFVKLESLPSDTAGLAVLSDTLVVFGREGTLVESDYVTLSAVDSDVDVESVLDHTVFSSKPYVIVETESGDRHHFYDGERVEDWDALADSGLTESVLAQELAQELSVTTGITSASSFAGNVFFTTEDYVEVKDENGALVESPYAVSLERSVERLYVSGDFPVTALVYDFVAEEGVTGIDGSSNHSTAWTNDRWMTPTHIVDSSFGFSAVGSEFADVEAVHYMSDLDKFAVMRQSATEIRTEGAGTLIWATAGFGNPSKGQYLGVYDSAAGAVAWSRLNDLPVEEISTNVSQLLPDGKIWMTGGNAGDTNNLQFLGTYDSAAGTVTWVQLDNLPVPDTYANTSVLLPDGKIWMTGGLAGTTRNLQFLGTYDSAAGTVTWVQLDNLPFEDVYGSTSQILSDGKIWMTGGLADTTDNLQFLGTYDAAAGTVTWVQLDNLPAEDVYYNTSQILSDGKIWMKGGFGDTDGQFLGTYDSVAGTIAWAQLENLPVKNGYYNTSQVLPDGKIWMAGGLSNGIGEFIGTYDAAAGTVSWVQLEGLPAGVDRNLTSQVFQDSYTLVTGSSDPVDAVAFTTYDGVTDYEADNAIALTGISRNYPFRAAGSDRSAALAFSDATGQGWVNGFNGSASSSFSIELNDSTDPNRMAYTFAFAGQERFIAVFQSGSVHYVGLYDLSGTRLATLNPGSSVQIAYGRQINGYYVGVGTNNRVYVVEYGTDSLSLTASLALSGAGTFDAATTQVWAHDDDSFFVGTSEAVFLLKYKSFTLSLAQSDTAFPVSTYPMQFSDAYLAHDGAEGDNVKITVTSQEQETVETGLQEVSVNVKAAAVGEIAFTADDKIYSASGSVIYFSGITDPMTWDSTQDDANDSGFIDISSRQSATRSIVSIASYYTNTAFFMPNMVSIWTLSSNSSNVTFMESVQGTGTTSPRSVVNYGNTDVFYLSDSGVRSLRAKDEAVAAYVNDVGSPIDPFVQEWRNASSEYDWQNAQSVVEPVDGRVWIAIGTRIFVFSYFPHSSVSSWSYYDIDFTVDSFAVVGQRLYVRSTDNDLYVYGGLDGTTYPADGEAPVYIETPFYEGQDPSTLKTFTDFDISCEGTWRIGLLTDPADLDASHDLGTVQSESFSAISGGAIGAGQKMAFNFSSEAAGLATLSGFMIQYNES